MMTAQRSELVKKYKEGYAVVAAALEGASDAELDRRPAPGKWTSREIVHHLADSEMTSAIRLRRLIAEDRPTIVGYDQEEYAERLHYDRPIAASRAERGGVGARRHALGIRPLQCAALAGDLRRPCARPRGPDPSCPAWRVELGVLPITPAVSTTGTAPAIF
jgi:hypothetical protein